MQTFYMNDGDAYSLKHCEDDPGYALFWKLSPLALSVYRVSMGKFLFWEDEKMPEDIEEILPDIEGLGDDLLLSVSGTDEDIIDYINYRLDDPQAVSDFENLLSYYKEQLQ